MNSERIQMDLVPCKRKQFRIRSRVNAMIKMDRIQNYPDSFGSDLYPLPCKRGLSTIVRTSVLATNFFMYNSQQIACI